MSIRQIGVLAFFLLTPVAGTLGASQDRWTTSGPWGGVVRAVAVAPSRPESVYAASARGIFRTTNGGNSWTPTPSSPPDQVFALAVDPSDPETLYAGSAWVFKSKDGGATWIQSGDLGDVSRVIIDPRNSQVVWAGTEAGVYKSTDGAGTWTRVLDGGGTGLSMDETNPDVLSAGTEWTSGRLFRTEDGGAKWTPLQVPTSVVISSVGVDSSTPPVLWAGTEGDGLFRSSDGGSTWSRSEVGEPFLFVYGIDVGSQGPGSVLLATDHGVYSSLDGGLHWANAGPPQNPDHFYTFFTLAVGPTGVWFVGREDGVYESQDFGRTWSKPDVGLGQQSVTSLAVDPFSSTILAGVLEAPGVFRSSDSGSSWTGFDTVGFQGWVNVLVFDPTQPGIVYAGTAGGVWKSADGASSWSELEFSDSGPYPAAILSLVIEPHHAQTLFAGTSCCSRYSQNGLFKSTDAGATWALSGVGIPFVSINALALRPDAAVLYAGTPAGLFRSTDDGASWARTSLTSPIGAVLVEPATLAVYAGFSDGGLWRSLDDGETWSPIGAGLPSAGILSMVANPKSPGAFYVGTSGAGVYSSADGGATFGQINDGLSAATVLSLAIDATGALHAGTASRGVYDRTLPRGRTIEREHPPERPTRTVNRR